jgi:hypothetical protein
LIISVLVICFSSGAVASSFGYWSRKGLITIMLIFLLGCYVLVFQLAFPLEIEGIPNWTHTTWFASIGINISFPPLCLFAIVGGILIMEGKK